MAKVHWRKATTKKTPMTKKTKLIWAGVAVLALLIVGVALLTPSDTATSSKNDEVVNEQPAEVVEEQSPVDTGPTDKELADKKIADKEVVYATKVGEDATMLSEALATIGEVSAGWPFDQDEVLEMAGAMVVIQLAYDEYRSMKSPSDRFAATHRQWKLALVDYNKAVDRLAYGFDNTDFDAIAQATTLIERGNEHISRASDKMPDVL